VDWFILVLIGLGAAVGLVLWRSRRQRAPIEEDNWALPSASDIAAEDLPPQVLDRDALLSRSRAFDPNAWDDHPDTASDDSPADEAATGPAGAADPWEVADAPESSNDLPRFFDRSYLEARERERRSGE